MTNTAEQELLAKAKRFDQDALGQIYDQYSTALYRYAYRQLGHAQMAEDCVAETFARFLNALKQNKGPKNHLRAYLYRIAHNWINDQYRRGTQPTDSIEDREDLTDDAQVSVEHTVQQNLEAEVIRGYLKELTDEQRQVIVLKHLENLDNAEVAEIMNKNVGSIKALNSRALNNLRKLMESGDTKS